MVTFVKFFQTTYKKPKTIIVIKDQFLRQLKMVSKYVETYLFLGSNYLFLRNKKCLLDSNIFIICLIKSSNDILFCRLCCMYYSYGICFLSKKIFCFAITRVCFGNNQILHL